MDIFEIIDNGDDDRDLNHHPLHLVLDLFDLLNLQEALDMDIMATRHDVDLVGLVKLK